MASALERSLRAIVLVAVTSLPLCRPAFGQNKDVPLGTPFSQEEYGSLPRYCWASNMINKGLSEPLLPESERQRWHSHFGKEFMHIHHWCWALMEVRRGNQAVDPRVSMAHYRAAITDFDYVIRNCGTSFPLRPEFHLRKGMALRLMKDDAAAAAEFSKAINVKPDYTPAYAVLVDLHLDQGSRQEAMRVLEVGLQRVPDSQILLAKKAELQNLAGKRESKRQ